MPKIVDKDAKRLSLIEAAAIVFAREGFARTKMAHIAAEAGVGKGTLYEYFASKNELFLSVCEHCVHWPEDASAFAANPKAGLRDLILTLFGSYESASGRSKEHTSELQSLMRISYAVFSFKKKTTQRTNTAI